MDDEGAPGLAVKQRLGAKRRRTRRLAAFLSLTALFLALPLAQGFDLAAGEGASGGRELASAEADRVAAREVERLLGEANLSANLRAEAATAG